MSKNILITFCIMITKSENCPPKLLMQTKIENPWHYNWISLFISITNLKFSNKAHPHTNNYTFSPKSIISSSHGKCPTLKINQTTQNNLIPIGLNIYSINTIGALFQYYCTSFQNIQTALQSTKRKYLLFQKA